MSNTEHTPVPASELQTSRGIILNTNGHDFDHYSYGLCSECGRWQQLIDWRGTHSLLCKVGIATHYTKRPPVARATIAKAKKEER